MNRSLPACMPAMPSHTHIIRKEHGVRFFYDVAEEPFKIIMGNICTSVSSSTSEPHRDDTELVRTRESSDATDRETGCTRKISVSKTLDRSNLEDIKSRFAVLLTSVKAALEANHVTAGDVRTVLVGMFTGSDDYSSSQIKVYVA